jgi:SSS family solute:Na+ symporter
MNLQFVDWLIVAVYGIVVVSLGLYVGRKPTTSEGYFLASRQLRWPFIGASLYAANISAEMLVGMAGCGFALGLAVAAYDWMAIFCMVPLIILFLPFYLKNKIFTVPEFLERRFSPGVRNLLSGFMVILSILTKISISLWAAAIVFHSLFGWDKMIVIWSLGLITAIYTMKGGLRAVVYTDALQTTVLIAAAVVMSAIGLYHVGGWSGLQAKLDPAMLHAIKPATDIDLPWFGVFITLWLAGSFYWSMDQVIVQRVFAAKSLDEGRRGAIFCGFLKVVNPFLLTLPGIIAKALYPDITNADDAYPTMLKNLMPTGLLGLTVAGMAAALMGHLSATYNSIATMFTRDFYLKWRPEASNDRQIFVGRCAVLTVFALGAIWAPIIGKFESLWLYLQSVSVYLVLPFSAVFFIGVLWKRINTTGVFAAVLIGFIIGPLLMFDAQMHFLPFMKHPFLRPWLNAAFFEFLACAVVLIAVSLLSAPPAPEKVANTTLNRAILRELFAPDNGKLLHNYRPWLILLILSTCIIWYIFR